MVPYCYRCVVRDPATVVGGGDGSTGGGGAARMVCRQIMVVGVELVFTMLVLVVMNCKW